MVCSRESLVRPFGYGEIALVFHDEASLRPGMVEVGAWRCSHAVMRLVHVFTPFYVFLLRFRTRELTVR